MIFTNAITPDKLGGSYRYARELADGLANSGVEVIVVARRIHPGDPALERSASGALISRFDVPSKSRRAYVASYPVAVARAVRRMLQAYPHAVVHTHYPVPALPVALTRRSFVSTFQAPVHRELLSERQGSYALPSIVSRPAVETVRMAERLIARRATRVIVLSEFSRSLLSQLNRRAAAEATVIPGGVDIDRFCPGPRGSAPWPALFTARRLVPRTGVGELISAMPAIVASFPQATLAVAGTGELEESLRGQVSALGLSDSVSLLGRVSEEELVRRYQQADLVVLPTQELEGFGLTTAEALACGTPVLGTPAGATPELLGAIDESLVAAGTAPHQIADAACALLGDRTRLETLARMSRARVDPSMGWKMVVQRHLEIYDSLASHRIERLTSTNMIEKDAS
jgi:glycosyltransferase involved in cell wall biosynthesis